MSRYSSMGCGIVRIQKGDKKRDISVYIKGDINAEKRQKRRLEDKKGDIRTEGKLWPVQVRPKLTAIRPSVSRR